MTQRTSGARFEKWTVLMAALAIIAELLQAGAGPATAAQGDLDPTFDGDGKVHSSFAASSSGRGVAIQDDGRIVVAGGVGNSPTADFALARYNPDGSLDATFGTGGKVVTSFPACPFPGAPPGGGASNDLAQAVAIQQPGNKIIVAGQTGYHSCIGLARYNPDGSLDGTFGTGGLVSVTGRFATGMAIQPADGKIIVAGGTGPGVYGSAFTVSRFLPDGDLDLDFGVGGADGDGRIDIPFGHGLEYGNAVAVQDDGRIVVAGSTGAGPSFAIARLLPDGTLDGGFASGGRQTIYFGVRDTSARGVAIQPDGRIVVVGVGGLARLGPDGSLDATFNGNGKVTISHPGIPSSGVVLQPDGKIVVSGGSGDLMASRFNADGSLDPTFSGDGQASVDFGGYEEGSSVALQADGKIVVAGGGTLGFVVARFIAVNTGPVAEAGGPYSVSEGGNLSLMGSGTDFDGDALTYAWDLDDDGIFETASRNPVFSAESLTAPDTHTVALRVCDTFDACASDEATVNIIATSCGSQPTGLVSWWPAEGNADDAAHGNDGVIHGGTAFVAGQVGQAFRFNGTNAHIRVPDNASLYPGAGSFTVGAWIKTTQMGSGNAFILAHYECGNGCPGGANSIYSMYVNGDGKLGGFLRDSAGASQSFTGPTVVADGIYHHVAMVRDTTGLQLQLYVDGALYASQPLIVTGTIKDDDGAPDPLTIGAIIQGGTNNPSQQFIGDIDEVEYYNRALYAGEIHALYVANSAEGCPDADNDGVPDTVDECPATPPGDVVDSTGCTIECVPPPVGMVSWWPGEGNADDIVDGNHGTLMNGVTIAAGKVGQGFSLDGADDFITVPNAPSLNPNKMTVMAWYRTTSFAGNGFNSIVQKAYVAHSAPYYQYQLGVAGNLYPFAPGGSFGFGVAAGGVFDGLSTAPGFWTPDRWYHLAGTYDGSDIKLYVDGALVGSRAASGPVPDYGKPVLIGRHANLHNPSIDFTPGMIDEVVILDRALEASEVEAIHNAGSVGICEAPPNEPPSADAGGPYAVPEGGSVGLTGSGDDPDEGDVLSYAWDLDNNGSYETAGRNVDFSAVGRDGPDSRTVVLRVCDVSDECATDDATVEITNVAPALADVSVSSSGIIEGDTLTLSGTIQDLGVLDTFTLVIDWGDGGPSETLDFPVGTTAFSLGHTYADDNPTGTPLDTNTIVVTVTDDDGDSGTAEAGVDVENEAPVVTGVTGPLDPIALGGSASVIASFTDLGVMDTHTCSFNWDDGTTSTVAASSGDCMSNRTYPAAGVYTVEVTVTDDDTGSASAKHEFVVIYDPDGGFVTGGGWINSPAGALLTNPDLTGKATFGFMSKYLPGRSVPMGNTEFEFKAGDFKFKSTAYEVLIVQGFKAQYKGEGTVNGSGLYKFILTAYDGQRPGGGGVDRMRIKIWDASGGHDVVYDNRRAVSDDMDDADPQAIGAGSIVIHKD